MMAVSCSDDDINNLLLILRIKKLLIQNYDNANKGWWKNRFHDYDHICRVNCFKSIVRIIVERTTDDVELMMMWWWTVHLVALMLLQKAENLWEVYALYHAVKMKRAAEIIASPV